VYEVFKMSYHMALVGLGIRGGQKTRDPHTEPEKPDPEPEKPRPQKPKGYIGCYVCKPEIITRKSGLAPRYPRNPNFLTA
jgi:hypothetical protein